MRLNKYLAENTNLSRRKADEAISNGLVEVNNEKATIGAQVSENDIVRYQGEEINRIKKYTTLLLNKPKGYVCSRNGQGSKTIYSLIPIHLHDLNPVGRLDKNSSGLLIMTNNGVYANMLSHPSNNKLKVYEISIDRPINEKDIICLNNGVELDDGISNLKVQVIKNNQQLMITMTEGKNRQIRRTFDKVGYRVTNLHRISFGEYKLSSLKKGEWKLVN